VAGFASRGPAVPRILDKLILARPDDPIGRVFRDLADR